MDKLYTYENTSLCLYTKKSEESSIESSLKIISDIENEKIGANFCQLPRTMINPFVMMKYWIKQEILDFEAVVQAINSTLI